MKSADDAALLGIQTNIAAQAADNEARIRELRRYATEGFTAVFDLAPLLLNINDPSMPGFVRDEETPFGVRLIERQWWLPRERHSPSLPRSDNPVVESLLLIGSSGSVGHTASSDLDYWVCYEPERLNGRPLALFRQKLAAISQWAWWEHGTEANFYLIDLREASAGRISSLEGARSEDAAAPGLLLEELYRTALIVAGRPPVWPVMPPNMGLEEYRVWSAALCADNEHQCIDLGFPAFPEPQEFLAAALWLARKSEADPFKGIMKMVAMLKYVESGPPLLCDTIKLAILKAAPEELPIDPYLMTIDAITEYGALSLPPDQLELLRASAVIKILGNSRGGQLFVLPRQSPKRKILKEKALRWGWDDSRLEKLDDYGRWPERERLHLGEELLAMLSSVYGRIADHLISNFPGEVNPQDRELAPLAARLLARRSGLDSTVEPLPSSLHSLTVASRFIITYNDENRAWRLHALAGGSPDENSLIYAAGRALRLAAWLVHNQAPPPGASLEFVETESLTASDFQKAVATLKKYFPTREEIFTEMHQGSPDGEVAHLWLAAGEGAHQGPADDEDAHLWSAAGKGEILVFLNFENPLEERLVSADYVLRTGWGEMRHFYVDVSDVAEKREQYRRIAWSLLREGYARPEKTVFKAPPRMRGAAKSIRSLLAAQKRQKPDANKSRIDI